MWHVTGRSLQELPSGAHQVSGLSPCAAVAGVGTRSAPQERRSAAPWRHATLHAALPHWMQHPTAGLVAACWEHVRQQPPPGMHRAVVPPGGLCLAALLSTPLRRTRPSAAEHGARIRTARNNATQGPSPKPPPAALLLAGTHRCSWPAAHQRGAAHGKATTALATEAASGAERRRGNARPSTPCCHVRRRARDRGAAGAHLRKAASAPSAKAASGDRCPSAASASVTACRSVASASSPRPAFSCTNRVRVRGHDRPAAPGERLGAVSSSRPQSHDCQGLDPRRYRVALLRAAPSPQPPLPVRRRAVQTSRSNRKRSETWRGLGQCVPATPAPAGA